MTYRFAENLKNLRLSKGLTQTQLAQRLWLNKSIISAYENETRVPSLEALIKLSNEFNVSMEYLLGIEREKTIDVTGLNEEQLAVVSSLIELLKKEGKNN
ncbi:MAG: helix-turn-helix transcriptional regulator [Clostridia bacterium]|nr:helix-turn-helix transcriptional regulator [Clostridia bacterium]